MSATNVLRDVDSPIFVWLSASQNLNFFGLSTEESKPDAHTLYGVSFPGVKG